MGEYVKGVGYKSYTDREAKLAAALEALAAQGKLILDPAQTTKYGSLENDLADIREGRASFRAAAERSNAARTSDADKKALVLLADVKILLRGPKCGADVPNRSSWTHTARCEHFATVERTWAANESRSIKADHEEGIFCTCENHEHQEFTWKRVEVTHTMTLCGTHRKVAGQYGWPY